MEVIMFATIIISALYGLTMKMADLFDEHGLKWFKGDAILFGLLWGLFGGLLILSGTDIANVTLAMILAFLVRMRLDYRNHAIASAMIIIAFIFRVTFDLKIFSIFFMVFTVFGAVKDYLGDVRKKQDWLYKVNEPCWYYPVPAAVYGMLSDNWKIFFVFTVYITFYNLTKLFYLKKYDL